MSGHSDAARGEAVSVEIRVRGRVQGVGFRPAVWRFARELELCGEVSNDASGVLIFATGTEPAISELIKRLRTESPPLARVETVETRPTPDTFTGGFRIGETLPGDVQTEVAPDAAICAACTQEILDSAQRRYGYAFANCTHCGPRLSIATAVPYDRGATTMARFDLCAECAGEYHDPSDRRFHAEAIACPRCGPEASLLDVRRGLRREDATGLEAVDRAARLLLTGHIVALKGMGGYQLACDATDAALVRRLRESKRREAKPFALMARDLDIIARYCAPNEEERRQLTSAAAPIVLLDATGPQYVPEAVAPGLRTVGFMLPTTPLHVLLLRHLDRPIVMTSGNLSGEPQITDDEEAIARLGLVTDHIIVHDRKIANRVDDSVVRVIGGVPRVLRRARGWAPATLKLPPGFDDSPDLLAFGGELKATFCLLKDGYAVLSPHQGDLEDVVTLAEFRRNLALFAELFDHAPEALVSDAHPEYLSAKLARERARDEKLRLLEVQHHHAHLAACLAENGRPLAAPAVLGIALDGLGWGEDGTMWGGEFLLADYRHSTRLGTFKPVAMLGGAQAAREPWRNLYAHVIAGLGWAEFSTEFATLEIYRYLAAKPREVLDTMLAKAINAPLASSCGRLFDAMAACLDLCRDRQAYEGEAASRLEATVDEDAFRSESDELAYPFRLNRPRGSELLVVDPTAMWREVLRDLAIGNPAALIAARFHKGLARAVTEMTVTLAQMPAGTARRFDTVALSGGCFQNGLLLADTERRLTAEGFSVLSHREVPSNDGGLSLGQAAIGAARLLADRGS